MGSILAGDYACALAQKALFAAAGGRARGVEVAGAFARMQRDVVFGQILDVGGRAEDVEAMHELKTASYTVLGPVELGALLGGASDETLAALRRYASPLGVAFQLCDDLLSAFGSEATTGKARGNDLRAGTRQGLTVAKGILTAALLADFDSDGDVMARISGDLFHSRVAQDLMAAALRR